MRRFQFLLLCTYITSCLIGQVKFYDNIEFELDNERVLSLFPVEDKTLNILTYKPGLNKRDLGKYILSKYDTSFVAKQSKEIVFESEYFPVNWVDGKESTVLVFMTKKGKMNIKILDKKTLEERDITAKFRFKVKKTQINSTAEIGDYIYLMGYYKDRPFINAYNKFNGEEKIVPIAFDNHKMKRVRLARLQTEGFINEAFLFANAIESRKTRKIYMQKLNGNGELGELYRLSDKFDKLVSNTSLIKLNMDKYMLTGTYSEKLSTAASGIYLGQMSEGKMDWVKYYDFLEFEDYLSYLPDRVEKRLKRKKQKKGDSFSRQFLITLHPLLRLDDGFLVVGENYYPTYTTRTVTRTRTDANGNTTTYTDTERVFDGFQYTHATIVKVSKTGDKLWDRNFKLNIRYKPQDPERFVYFKHSNYDKNFKFIYSAEDSIFTKKIDLMGNILEEETSYIKQTKYKEDKIKRVDASYNYLKHWYDDIYFHLSSMKIKNRKNKKVKNKRWVYSINKFSYK